MRIQIPPLTLKSFSSALQTIIALWKMVMQYLVQLIQLRPDEASDITVVLCKPNPEEESIPQGQAKPKAHCLALMVRAEDHALLF